MTAARAALKWRRAKRARSGPWLRSLGQIRKNHGLIPERAGLEAEGEIIATGLVPAPRGEVGTSKTFAWVGARARLSPKEWKRNAERHLPQELPRVFRSGFSADVATVRVAALAPRRRFTGVTAIERLCRFTAALEALLVTRDAAAFEAEWTACVVERLAWDALAGARRPAAAPLERPLAELHRCLLALLERAQAMLDVHILTFRGPEMDRWQHPAAAPLVGAGWGVWGAAARISARTTRPP